MFLKLLIMFLSGAISSRIQGNVCEHCILEADCYLLEDFLNRIPFSFYRYFYSRIHCGYKGYLATICCDQDFLNKILRELNTDTINSHDRIKNLHAAIENPHEIIDNPYDTIGNPQDTIGNPQDTIGNPHDTIGNPQDTIGNPHDTIGNPQDTIGNPHDTIGNPQDTIGNPHDTIGNPQDTIGNPHDTIGNPQDTIVNPHDTIFYPYDTIYEPIDTIITQKYDNKGTSTEGTLLTETYKINDHCEMKESRIIGGVTASLGLFPWMAKLGYTSGENPEESPYESDSSKDLVYRCGGSLVTLRHVLTAAHCLVGLPKGMILTIIELDADRDRIRRFPNSVTSHPGYNDSGTSNDLGIIKLNRPVALSNAVMPICLPIDQYVVDPSKLRRRSLIVAGWGTVRPESTVMSDRLRYTRLNYMDDERCRSLYRTRYGVDINDGHLCTVPDGQRDACYGDSGGPLFTWADGGDSRSAVLIAVVSFGSNVCAASDVPPVFTRIVTYMDWITEHIH